MNNPTAKQWYPVYTKHRKENLAQENLINQGYETYHPRIKLKRRYKNKWIERIESLFPRYIFIRLEQGRDNFSPIRSTIGVTDMVRFNGGPTALPPDIIDQIKASEDLDLGIHISKSLWKPGKKVAFTHGPFEGLNGIYQEPSGEKRVVVLLNMLGRVNNISVERNSVIPLNE